MIQPTKTIQMPELLDSFLSLKNDIFFSINCIKIGKIQSFNVSRKTAEVQILFKRVVPDAASATGISIKSYPVLVDCPVFTLQGGGAAIQPPIAAGDQCILLFSDRNIDAWFQNGNESAPFDARAHDLSDGIAMVGINALTSTLASYATDELKITYGGAKIGEKNGKITIQNTGSNMITLITGFIDVLKGLTDANGVALSPASIAALEAQKALFQALLY